MLTAALILAIASLFFHGEARKKLARIGLLVPIAIYCISFLKLYRVFPENISDLYYYLVNFANVYSRVIPALYIYMSRFLSDRDLMTFFFVFNIVECAIPVLISLYSLSHIQKTDSGKKENFMNSDDDTYFTVGDDNVPNSSESEYDKAYKKYQESLKKKYRNYKD